MLAITFPLIHLLKPNEMSQTYTLSLLRDLLDLPVERLLLRLLLSLSRLRFLRRSTGGEDDRLLDLPFLWSLLFCDKTRFNFSSTIRKKTYYYYTYFMILGITYLIFDIQTLDR